TRVPEDRHPFGAVLSHARLEHRPVRYSSACWRGAGNNPAGTGGCTAGDQGQRLAAAEQAGARWPDRTAPGGPHQLSLLNRAWAGTVSAGGAAAGSTDRGSAGAAVV